MAMVFCGSCGLALTDRFCMQCGKDSQPADAQSHVPVEAPHKGTASNVGAVATVQGGHKGKGSKKSAARAASTGNVIAAGVLGAGLDDQNPEDWIDDEVLRRDLVVPDADDPSSEEEEGPREGEGGVEMEEQGEGVLVVSSFESSSSEEEQDQGDEVEEEQEEQGEARASRARKRRRCT